MRTAFDNFESSHDLCSGDCEYHTPSQLAHTIKTKHNNELALIHFNVRSSPKNKSKIELFLTQMPTLPEIIAISETKLNSSKRHLVDIKNYNFAHSDSLTNAGGLGIYIRKDLSCCINYNFSVDNNDCESLFIEILNKSPNNKHQPRKNIIVGVICRHPRQSYSAFQDKLCNIIHELNRSSSFFLVGDYNIDLSKINSDVKVKNYLGDLYSAGCYSLINVPTRISPTCTSTLDHIYTNSINKTRLSGVLTFDLSDHLPTFCILQTAGKPNKKETSNRLIHDMKNFNIETYAEDAYNRLQCLSLLSDPDTDLNNLMKIIQEVTSIHAPLRRPSRKEMKAKSKPWLTKSLLKSVKTKNKMFQFCYKQHNVDLIMKYKKYRNKLTKLTQIAKRMYYQNQLTSHKNDLSQRWKIINEIICNKKRHQEMITSIIDSEGKEVSDQSIISKTLNEFFVNIGPNMDAKIPPSRNIFNISINQSNLFFAMLVIKQQKKIQYKIRNKNKTMRRETAS